MCCMSNDECGWRQRLVNSGAVVKQSPDASSLYDGGMNAIWLRIRRGFSCGSGGNAEGKRWD